MENVNFGNPQRKTEFKVCTQCILCGKKFSSFYRNSDIYEHLEEVHNVNMPSASQQEIIEMLTKVIMNVL